MVSFILNGEKVQSSGSGQERLLDVLRKEFSLTGPKEGCGEGECGACAVLVDGRLMNSCITPLANVEGREVMTIEGYSKTERYKVLERCFAEEGAVQCGFCTPGMTMAAESLLSSNPEPDDGEIRLAISGNLCRCTGYNMIINAIRKASKEGKGLW
ncbi:MAG: (2Fe-2S)-binding protein [Lachnospiraceae bacterium]|nr:(2Fe-2S)-binding protein [Lachnospiraceae bacterium]